MLVKEAESIDPTEQLKAILTILDIDLKQTESILSSGEQLIKDHCAQLRQTKETNENQLNQINKYEEETLETYAKTNKDKFVNKFTEIRSFINKWTNSAENNTKEILKAIDLANDIKSKLCVEIQNIRAFIFNGQLLEFKNNILEISSFYAIDFNSLTKIDLNKHFESFKQSYADKYEDKKVFVNVIGFGFFESGNFVVIGCFHDNSKNGNLNLFLFDENKSLIKTVQIVNAFAGDMQLVGNRICFMYYQFDRKVMLRVIDDNINTVCEIEADKRGLIGADSSFIYITPEDPKDPLITYDWSLKLVKRKRVYKFSTDVFDLKSRNGKYYFIEHDQFKFYLKIVDISTGVVEKSIAIKGFSSLHIDSNSNVVIYDGLKLVYLSQLGEVLNMIKLTKFPEPDTSRWTMDFKNNFYVLEEDNLCLSIKNI